MDRHASGHDASQLSYILVALRYESQGVGLAELVSTIGRVLSLIDGGLTFSTSEGATHSCNGIN